MKRKRELTAKQRLFIQAYQLNGANATQAAISAGYSVKSAEKIGSELLHKTRVRRALEIDIAKRERRIGIKTDKMLAHLYAIATSEVTDFYRFNASGLELKDSSEIKRAKLAAIESVTETVTQVGGSVNVKMHPKQAAAVFLLKYYGKYVEKQKHEHEGKVTLEQLVGDAGDSGKGDDSEEG